MVNSQSEIKDLFENTVQEIEGITMPIDDTFNTKNGMNYAMFLEAILRICYYRAENEGVSYKKVLDQTFNEAGNNVDVQKRIQEEPVLAIVYSPEICEEFNQSSLLLQSIFDKKASNPEGVYVEMKHDEFVQTMIEAHIVILPKKKEEKKEEKGGKKT